MTIITRQSAGQPTGGQFAAHTRTESPIELHSDLVAVPMAEGGVRIVPTAIADEFRGVSPGGYNVVAAFEKADGSEYLVGLTKCCNSTAKGSEDGIVCRRCYSECDPMLGGPIELSAVAPRIPAPATEPSED